jgi:hypothetical protein
VVDADVVQSLAVGSSLMLDLRIQPPDQCIGSTG